MISPVFMEHGVERPPIRFKKGLNVVLGAEDGAMSIGKSSTLLAIDFVFGGNTYIKSDGVKNVGHHIVAFKFEFDNKEYFFGRNTAKPDEILIGERNYIFSGKTISKDEYCNWLKEKYCIDYPGLSFRAVLSSFFRIYGKRNTDETNPLQGIPGKSMEKSITTILTIFNKYGDVEIFKKNVEEHKDRLDAFNKARKYNFISNLVGGDKQYRENFKSIKKLELKLNELRDNTAHGQGEDDIENNKKRSALIATKFSVETELQAKERKLQLVDMSLEYGLYPTDADFAALQEYFPGVNLRKLYDVEKYHRKLAKILDGQFADERMILQKDIAKIKDRLESIKEKLEELGVSDGISKEFLDNYSEIKGEIDALKIQNKAYVTLKNLQEAKANAGEVLKKSIENILHDIETKLNAAMKEINDSLFKTKRKPPQLHFNQYNSYRFVTPADTGTGSNFKGMIVYDLAMLFCTKLPAIAHDSLLFKNLEKDVEDGIIRLYDTQDKQVFIAYDKHKDCRPETRQRLEANTVIKLSENDGALYGKTWNKVDS